MSDGRLPRPHRRWLGWTFGILITLLVLSIGWVTIRGIGAVTELQQVAKLSSQLKAAVGDGDLEKADDVAGRIARHAQSAHGLTSDPVWQAFGVIPWLGPNFTAVGEVSAIADDIASNGVQPVLKAAGSIDLASLGLSGGTVNLAPFAEIEPSLGAADAVLSAAEDRALQIDADATLPPLADAVGELRSTVTEAATVVGSLHGASVLLPSMLGADGPRNYVVAMLNNAELRSTGGIIGAIALMHAENGQLTLVQQASTADFPPLDDPLPLSESTIALFEERPGRYLQNITSIPDFAEAGPVIAARWQQRFGGTVDGVIAVDTVVASHLLAATGPLTFGPFTATADNVVSLLLSDIYAQVPDPAVQDEIFAQAATAMLAAGLSSADPQSLVTALTTSADERRVRIWSSHEDEEKLLAASTLGGTIPTDGADGIHVGVLINDATGAKMDFYTDAAITTSIGTCNGKPTTRVQVTWTNNAPADAATSLPAYVTGNGIFGVYAGHVRTMIAIYGPEGATPSATDRDGSEEPVQTALLGTRSVIQHIVELEPGESTTITVDFQGTGAGDRLTGVEHTPMVNGPEMTRDELHCNS